MADLPTNYLDDILAQSMNGKRKFRITRPDGTFEEVIIEDISEYLQTGSTFGAGDINRTNQAVNEKFDSGDVVDPMLTTELGFAADAYQTKLQFDELNKNKVPTLIKSHNNSILEYAKGIEEDSKIEFFALTGSMYVGNDLPSLGYAYGAGVIIKRSKNSIFVIIFSGYANSKVAKTHYNGSEWENWNDFQGIRF